MSWGMGWRATSNIEDTLKRLEKNGWGAAGLRKVGADAILVTMHSRGQRASAAQAGTGRLQRLLLD